MAIVIRSERDFNLAQNSSGVIGPGDYDKNNLSEKINQNQAPFNTKSLRYFEFSNKRNPEIGPGSYYHPKQRSFIRKSFNRNHSSLELLNKKDLYNLALFKVVKGKKEIKIKEQKSLIIDKDNKNQVMNINTKNASNNNSNNISSTIDARINSPKKYYKLVPTTLTKNRINSIPSKEHCLGYDFDDNGLPIIVDPSSINNENNNEENEKINENNNKKDKKINAIDWSKMSKKDISEIEITTKDNSINNNNNSKVYYNNSTIKDYNGITYNTTDNSNIIKKRQVSSNESERNLYNVNQRNKIGFFNSNESISSLTNNDMTTDKNSSIIYKSFSDEYYPYKKTKIKGNVYKINSRDIKKKSKIMPLEDFVYENLFKGDPGPGYYQEQSDFDKYILISNKYRNFNFGSNDKRYKNNFNSYETINLGPGYYFRESNTPKFKARFFPLSRKEETINIKKYEKDLVNENMGPGKYNIKSQFDKTQIYYSGPLEKRFYENIKKINPGPGEYLQLVEWGKNINENQILKPNLYLNIKKNENNSEKKEEKGRYGYISRNENPGVGDYNPHIINSIKYDIISKDNKVSNLIAPFYSGQEKFLKKSSSISDLIGPGSYFPNINIRNNSFKKEENKKGNHLYKNNGIKKDNIKFLYNQMKLNSNMQIGPGSYELNKYNDWNKKSFNALYV